MKNLDEMKPSKQSELWLKIGCGYIHEALLRLSGAIGHLTDAQTLREVCAEEGRMPAGVANLIDSTGNEATDLLWATHGCLEHALRMILKP